MKNVLPKKNNIKYGENELNKYIVLLFNKYVYLIQSMTLIYGVLL